MTREKSYDKREAFMTREKTYDKRRVSRPQTSSSPPPPLPLIILLLAVPRRLFCFGYLVILDVVCRYLSLFLLYIDIIIGNNRC